MNTFKEIDPKELNEGATQLVGFDWMLITAGNMKSFNTMTAAWGGLGFLWKKPVSFIYIRPQRYTYEFVEKYDHFTLTFFEEKYRDILRLCGGKSGRDIDKMHGIGLTPMQGDNSIYFEEARIVLECKKIYADMIKPEHFIDNSIDINYPKKDYHKYYIGEITKCMIK